MPKRKSSLDTSGPAIIGMVLAQSLIVELADARVLNERQVDMVMERALSAVANRLPPDDPAVAAARAIITMMARDAVAVRGERRE